MDSTQFLDDQGIFSFQLVTKAMCLKKTPDLFFFACSYAELEEQVVF